MIGTVCTLGIDLGTSSAKAVVIDTGGVVLSQASADYAVTSTKAGYAEVRAGPQHRAMVGDHAACAVRRTGRHIPGKP
jgi:ribulose kinase